MNSRERFIATVERKPVDRPACWLGDPTPEAVPALCDYYHVDNIKELKKVCGDDFYAVEIPYKSPTCSAIFAAFDWYMNGSNVDTEHRTLTADGCFAQCEDLEDVEAVNFPWPDPELYIDPEECRRLVDEAPDDLNEKLNNQLLPFLPFSTYFIITTLFVILVIVILRYTRLGRNIHMVGGNAETAWLAGIHSDRVVIAAFIISGLAAGLGGALNGIYSGAANVTMGEKGISPFYMAFTATVIGGTDIYGGKGSVGWTYISLLMIAFLKSLCKSTELQVLVIGAALVLCLIYETVAKYNKDKILGRRPNLHLEHLKEMKGAK